MYTKIQVSYGPVLFADLRNFYLLRKQDITESSGEIVYTYFVVGVYNSKEYDIEKDIYDDLKEKYNTIIQDELNHQVRIAMLSQASKDQPKDQLKKVRESLKDAEI